MGVEPGRGRESPSPHTRGVSQEHFSGSARAVVWGGFRRVVQGSFSEPPSPTPEGAKPTGERSRQGPGAGDSLSMSPPHLPGQSLNFSRGALDSEALGLEPRSWRSWGLRTVAWVAFSEKIRPREGTKAPWGPGGWRQAAGARSGALLGGTV